MVGLDSEIVLTVKFSHSMVVLELPYESYYCSEVVVVILVVVYKKKLLIKFLDTVDWKIFAVKKFFAGCLGGEN